MFCSGGDREGKLLKKDNDDVIIAETGRRATTSVGVSPFDFVMRVSHEQIPPNGWGGNSESVTVGWIHRLPVSHPSDVAPTCD